MLFDRKLIRQHLASLLTASGDYSIVYDYSPKRTQGYSPLAIVVPEGTERNFQTRDLDISFINLQVVHMVKRDDSTTYLDTLDNLELTLSQILRNNTGTAYWHDITFSAPSEVRWGKLDDQPYVIETFHVRVKTI